MWGREWFLYGNASFAEEVEGNHLPICNKTITRRVCCPWTNVCGSSKKLLSVRGLRIAPANCIINSFFWASQKVLWLHSKGSVMMFYDLIRNRTKKRVPERVVPMLGWSASSRFSFSHRSRVPIVTLIPSASTNWWKALWAVSLSLSIMQMPFSLMDHY